MNLLGIDNAIAWAHFQLRGGWRQIASTTGLYVGIVVVLIILSTRAIPAGAGAGASFGTWTKLLLAAQAGILVLYIPSRISAAVRADITSGIIESHRMMPLPPASAVAGYLWGPAWQGLALAGATLVLGAMSGAAAGISLDRWIIPNFILLEFAAFVVVLSAFAAFLGQAAGVILLVLGLNLWFGFNTGQAFPGLVALISPIIGDSIFAWRTKTVEISWALSASMAAHVIIAAILFAGAARKYRRFDQPALGVMLGLALLGAWVGVSALGIVYWPEFQPTFLDRRALVPIAPSVQLIASLIAAMLLACVPLTNVARDDVEWRRRAQRDALAPPRAGRLPAPLAALSSSAILLGLPLIASWGWGDEVLADRLARTAVVLAAHCFAVLYLQRMVLRFTPRPGLLALFLVALWATPIVADVARAVLSDNLDSPLGPVSTASPAGALIAIWYDTELPVPTTMGLIVQAAVAIALSLLATVTEPRGGRAT